MARKPSGPKPGKRQPQRRPRPEAARPSRKRPASGKKTGTPERTRGGQGAAPRAAGQRGRAATEPRPAETPARAALERHYEGDSVLGALLAVGGSQLTPEDVKRLLLAALEEGIEPRQVFPSLFEGEPRFPSPAFARRFYSNLFGLWDQLERGDEEQEEEVEEAVAEEEELEMGPPEPPGPGALTPEYVETAWRWLADLPERERTRLRHRYENSQPALLDWISMQSGDAQASIETIDELAFELWAMLDLAGRAPAPVDDARLEAHLAEGRAPGAEPAVAAYAAESIAEAELDEEEPLSPEDARRLERVALAVLRAFTAAR